MYLLATPFVVRLRRWYTDPRQWIFIAGMVTNLGPIALNSLGLLHLGDTQAFVVGLSLNAAMNAAGAYINYQSTHVIGSKADIATTAEATGVLVGDPATAADTAKQASP